MSRRRQQGPAHQGGLENLSQNATQAQQNLAESLGKRTGLKFILEDSLESGAVGEYEGKKARFGSLPTQRTFFEQTATN